MIKFGPRPPRPEYLDSEPVNNQRQRIQNIIDAGNRTKSTDFTSLWLNEDVRNPLWEMQHRKCAFCERRRELKRESDVEHFRPKTEVSNLEHPGYWWLAYEWDNFLYACKPCNQDYKKNYFPISDEQARARCPEDDVLLEAPKLLNPSEDDPEEYLGYDWSQGDPVYVKCVSLDDEVDGRGRETIKIAGLNRKFLMEERAEKLDLLKNLMRSMVIALHFSNQQEINDFASQIRKLTSPNATFAGFNRYYFRQAGLGHYVYA